MSIWATAAWRYGSMKTSGWSAPPIRLDREVRWGRWRLRPRREGLHVRGWRAGDRLAARNLKVQDLFVDAKVPRSEREAWPLVVRGDEVVYVPGIAAAPGWEDAVEDEIA